MSAVVSSIEEDRRLHPRFSLCARAELLLNRHMSEHVVYDLSLGGMRLCGLPAGLLGDRVCALLYLPEETIVLAGQLVRVSRGSGVPSFAVRFGEVSSEAEAAIGAASLEATRRPDEPSILSIESPAHFTHTPDWLAPVDSVCVRVQSELEVTECIVRHQIQLSLLRGPSTDIPDWAWHTIYPEQLWRMMDPQGQLRIPPE